MTDDERAKLMAAKILKTKEKNRIHYRINGIRQLTGGRKNEIELPSHLEKLLKETESEEEARSQSHDDLDLHVKGMLKDLSENGRKSVIEFAASSYAVLENEQVCRIIIERYGKLDQDVTFR